MSLDNYDIIDKLDLAVREIQMIMTGKFSADAINYSLELIKEAIEMLKNDGVSNE